MRKFAKMSLVAAVAVAGLSSTVSAQPLEEAIKGVDVSGMLRYRYDDTSTNKAVASGAANASTQSNEYTMKIATKSKVNDAVTANVQVEALGVNTNALAGTDTAEQVHATSKGTGDRDVNLVVTKANFAVSLAGATIIAGKQSVPTPMVDNSVDDVTRGTGAVALVPAGPVTIAAGYFNNLQRAETTTNFGSSTTAVGLLGNVAGIGFDAWYANMKDTRKGTSIGANASVAGVSVDARYTSVDQEAVATQDSKLTKVVASTKVGGLTLIAGAAVTNKVSTTQATAATGVTLDGDNDSKSDFKVWQASVGGLSDATALLIGASMEVIPGLTADLRYVTVGSKTVAATPVDVDTTEMLLMATYAMSKNFAVQARYSELNQETNNVKGTEKSKGRLEVKYTF